MANFQEGSSRINLPSGYDFTSGGTNYYAPYTVVKISAGSVVPVTATTDAAVGVIYNNPTASGTADVVALNQQGSIKVTAGGSIAVGAFVTFNSSGQAIQAAQTAGGSQPAVQVIGRALEAGVTGKVISIETLYFLY